MTDLRHFWHNLIDPTREHSALKVIELPPETLAEFAARVAHGGQMPVFREMDGTPRW